MSWKKGQDQILKIDMTLAGVDKQMNNELDRTRIESYDSQGTLIQQFSDASADYASDYVQLVNYSGDYLMYFAGSNTTNSATGTVKHVIYTRKADSNFTDSYYDDVEVVYFGNLEGV